MHISQLSAAQQTSHSDQTHTYPLQSLCVPQPTTESIRDIHPKILGSGAEVLSARLDPQSQYAIVQVQFLRIEIP